MDYLERLRVTWRKVVSNCYHSRSHCPFGCISEVCCDWSSWWKSLPTLAAVESPRQGYLRIDGQWCVMNEGNVVADFDGVTDRKRQAMQTWERVAAYLVVVGDWYPCNQPMVLQFSEGHSPTWCHSWKEARRDLQRVGHIIRSKKAADAQQESRVGFLTKRSDLNPDAIDENDNDVTAGHAASSGRSRRHVLPHEPWLGSNHQNA